jgi:hypothetical protein
LEAAQTWEVILELEVALTQEQAVVSAEEVEEVRHVMKDQWIDSVVVVGTDEVELRGFDNKCILGYFKEKEFLSIVKEWKTKDGKQLERQNKELEKRQQDKHKKKQLGALNKNNKE